MGSEKFDSQEKKEPLQLMFVKRCHRLNDNVLGNVLTIVRRAVFDRGLRTDRKLPFEFGVVINEEVHGFGVL